MIVAAAIKIDGKVFSAPKPARHNHVMAAMIKAGHNPRTGIQGFLTDAGEFLNRSEAEAHARSCGQVAEIIGYELTTEDLW